MMTIRLNFDREECHLGDPIPEEDIPSPPEYSKEIEQGLINEAFRSFEGRDRDILLCRFTFNDAGDPRPLDDIKNLFPDVSTERILFLEARAFRLLKHPRKRGNIDHDRE